MKLEHGVTYNTISRDSAGAYGISDMLLRYSRSSIVIVVAISHGASLATTHDDVRPPAQIVSRDKQMLELMRLSPVK
jgi:hypothetical protein